MSRSDLYGNGLRKGLWLFKFIPKLIICPYALYFRRHQLEHGMPYFGFIWELIDDGNVAHIVQHGLTPEDLEPIVLNSEHLSLGRSSARPIAFGYTDDVRHVVVIHEQIDDCTVYPITAFEVDEQNRGQTGTGLLRISARDHRLAAIGRGF